MSLYLDTSALLKLYVDEPLTRELHECLGARSGALFCHEFHLLEAENAVQLKVFRREISPGQALAVTAKMREHAQAGMLQRRVVDWPGVLMESRRVAEAFTATTGCRTLDILHIAIARQWGCTEFLSLDDRQVRAAEAAGLTAIDPRRRLPPGPPRETP